VFRSGNGPQALVYMPGAAPQGIDAQGLQPLDVAGQAARFSLVPVSHRSVASSKAPTSVTPFEQGLVQVLEAAVTELEPKQSDVLALAAHADGSDVIEPLSSFVTNPASAQIVNAIGPIRQVVQGGADAPRRHLVILNGSPTDLGSPAQVQAD
jgi:hypothetical protein